MVASDILRGVTVGDSGASATTTTSIAVTAPTGVATGDELLVGIFLRTAVTLPGAWRIPAGWTELYAATAAAGDGFFYRATYGTDVTGTSWTWDNGAGNVTANRWAYSCIALTGVGGYLTGGGLARTTSTTSTPSPSISPAASCYLVAGAGDRSTASPNTWTWPAGWVEESDSGCSGTNATSATFAINDTTPSAAGTYSVTATASTASTSAWAGIFAYGVASTPSVTLAREPWSSRARFRATLW